MRAPARRDTWPTANLASSSPSAAAAGHGARFDFATQTVQPDLASPKAVTKPAGDDAEAKREEQLVQDYHMLAQACHRGGRVRGEAFNYFCMGVLLDNLQQYRRAIDSYDKFLTLCQHSKDQQGEMLALNAIGVSYQQMGIEYVTPTPSGIEAKSHEYRISSSFSGVSALTSISCLPVLSLSQVLW